MTAKRKANSWGSEEREKIAKLRGLVYAVRLEFLAEGLKDLGDVTLEEIDRILRETADGYTTDEAPESDLLTEDDVIDWPPVYREADAIRAELGLVDVTGEWFERKGESSWSVDLFERVVDLVDECDDTDDVEAIATNRKALRILIQNQGRLLRDRAWDEAIEAAYRVLTDPRLCNVSHELIRRVCALKRGAK